MVISNVSVIETGSFDDFRDALKHLGKMKAYVGIPEKETSRPGEEITNAGLLFIHTNGSPLQHIPARPVIEPAIEAADNKKMITDELEQVISSELDGKNDEAVAHLIKAGTLGSNAAKRWFRDPRNNWAPLSTNPLGSFLAGKVSKSLNYPVTPDMSYADAKQASGFDKTLIITGELRRAITHVEEY